MVVGNLGLYCLYTHFSLRCKFLFLKFVLSMPKVKEVSAKHDNSNENEASVKFRGELLKNHQEDSSGSDETPHKKSKKHVIENEKGDRPARRPKVRVSQYVRGEAPAPSKFVMKLFDRSVDLAQFTLESPLYPICRAWFQNDPHQEIRSDFKSRKDEDVKNIPRSQLYSSDAWHDPFIFPKRKPSEDFSLEYDTLIPLPTKEELLKLNMMDWKAVRVHARNESNKRLQKYKPTLESLRKSSLT